MRASERTEQFRVMGCGAIVTAVDGPLEAVATARGLLDELESRWSRFLPDSELNALNDAAGSGWCGVSELTFALVERMVHGWRHTGGAFDPTVTGALEAAGYDRNFAEVRRDGVAIPAGAAARPVPGCGGIGLDRHGRRVCLPAGVRLDAGGIGKGLAADLAVARLMRLGCSGAMASVGGDVRVCGRPPQGERWRAEVADAGDARIAERTLLDGAVATSSTALRRWRVTGPDGAAAEAHHVIDPATGRPAVTDVVLVSVSTGRGWWSEVLATAALARGRAAGAALLDAHGADAVLVDADGAGHVVGAAFSLLAPSAGIDAVAALKAVS